MELVVRPDRLIHNLFFQLYILLSSFLTYYELTIIRKTGYLPRMPLQEKLAALERLYNQVEHFKADTKIAKNKKP